MGFFSWAGRTAEVFGQGVVKGLASGAASIGDFAVDVGYNWTTRNAINAFRGEDSKLQSFDPHLADRAAEAVTWTEPRNAWERGVMTTGQVVGEVGGFVAITVATGGLGGAAFGTARAGAGATRIGAALMTGGRWAANTARFMNPAATRTALAVEGAVGAYRGTQIYNLDSAAAENARTVREDAGQEALDDAAKRQEFLNDVLTRQGEELRDIINEINGGAAPDREAELRERIEQIREDRDIIGSLRGGNLSDEQRDAYMRRLHGEYPDTGDQPAAAGSAISPYARNENGGNLSRAFADGGNAAQAKTAPVREHFAASVSPSDAPAAPAPTNFRPLTQELV